jgi:hypothetical protein
MGLMLPGEATSAAPAWTCSMETAGRSRPKQTDGQRRTNASELQVISDAT